MLSMANADEEFKKDYTEQEYPEQDTMDLWNKYRSVTDLRNGGAAACRAKNTFPFENRIYPQKKHLLRVCKHLDQTYELLVRTKSKSRNLRCVGWKIDPNNFGGNPVRTRTLEAREPNVCMYWRGPVN